MEALDRHLGFIFNVFLTFFAVLVVCTSYVQVTQLDPPSKGMLWQRLTGISMDLALGEVSLYVRTSA